jgi:hypothetical protein
MDDPNPKIQYSPVARKLREDIEKALKAEFTAGGIPHIATTHAKGPDPDRGTVNLIVIEELNPQEPILPDELNPLKPNR